MCHRANHRVRRAPRKLGIRIERDHILCVLKSFEVAGFYREGIELALEQLVKVEQLAALAFPAHPDALACVENTMAVQQEERPCSRSVITFVQLVCQLDGQLNEWVGVIRPRACDRVGKIGEQTEMYIAVLVG